MNARTRAVQERRRSGAAGPHGGRPTRSAELADALEDFYDNDPDDDAQEATRHEHL